MREPPIDLDQVLSWIDSDDGEPLQLVTDAIIISGRLGELADQVVDHFVQRARAGGASWAEIGESMGVSKQAAQKKFAGDRRAGFRLAKSGLFTRFDVTGRFVVQTAVGHAHGHRSMEITTIHLVLGLADPGSGRASTAIAELAGSATNVTDAATTALLGPKRPRRVKHLPFTDDCKKVLELSLREAIRASSRHIGGEHILLGLLRDEGSDGARLLQQHGVSRAGVESWLDENQVNDR